MDFTIGPPTKICFTKTARLRLIGFSPVFYLSKRHDLLMIFPEPEKEQIAVRKKVSKIRRTQSKGEYLFFRFRAAFSPGTLQLRYLGKMKRVKSFQVSDSENHAAPLFRSIT